MIIIGHRGYPLKYPENTVASFLGALLHGSDGVELDVWLSKDNRVVVIHDRDTSRVSGVTIDVKQALYTELTKIDLGMGQHIPLLEDVFKAIPTGKLVFVEIKDPDATVPAYETAKKAGRLTDTVFISFLDNVLVKLRQLDEKVRLGYNIGSVEAANNAFILHKKIGLYSINPPIQGLQLLGRERFHDYLLKVRALGVKTVVWTVDDPLLIDDLRDIIDVVITNNVEAFVSREKQRV